MVHPVRSVEIVSIPFMLHFTGNYGLYAIYVSQKQMNLQKALSAQLAFSFFCLVLLWMWKDIR
jgi:hypothetical protein